MLSCTVADKVALVSLNDNILCNRTVRAANVQLNTTNLSRSAHQLYASARPVDPLLSVTS